MQTWHQTDANGMLTPDQWGQYNFRGGDISQSASVIGQPFFVPGVGFASTALPARNAQQVLAHQGFLTAQLRGPAVHQVGRIQHLPTNFGNTQAFSNQAIALQPHRVFAVVPAASPCLSEVDAEKVSRVRDSRLVECVKQYLQNPANNPRRGSISVDKIQSGIRNKHPDLYNSVVQQEYGNQFVQFLKDHPDDFQIVQSVHEGKKTLRVHLSENSNWESADRQDTEEKKNKELLVLNKIQILLEYQSEISLDDFVTAYNDRYTPTTPDAVLRILRKYPDSIAVDESSRPEIILRKMNTGNDMKDQSPSKNRRRHKKLDTPVDSFDATLSSSVNSNMVQMFIPTAFDQTFDIPTMWPVLPAQSAPIWDPRLAGLSVDAEQFLILPQTFSAPIVYSPTMSMDSPHNTMANTDRELPRKEEELKEHIVEFLRSTKTNPYQGSVSSERVQNCIKTQHAQLYKEVVGHAYHGQWHEFLNKHKDTFTVFNIEENRRVIYRIRLREIIDWETKDRREADHRKLKDEHLMTCLTSYLITKEGCRCKVDEFIEAYPSLPQCLEWPSLHPDFTEVPKLPPRGDFVRFVRRYHSVFSYDSTNYVISLTIESQRTARNLTKAATLQDRIETSVNTPQTPSHSHQQFSKSLLTPPSSAPPPKRESFFTPCGNDDTVRTLSPALSAPNCTPTAAESQPCTPVKSPGKVLTGGPSIAPLPTAPSSQKSQL